MDREQFLIASLLKTRDMQSIIEARITEEYFTDSGHARVFRFITNHFARHGEVPLAIMVKDNWPDYKIPRVDHGIDYFIEQVRKQYLKQQIGITMADATDALEENDPSEALRILQEDLSRFALLDSTMQDIELRSTWEERLTEYEEYKGTKGALRGISTGFASLDKATLGLQPKQFIVLIGLPKSGKSTILLRMALTAHEAGNRVLFIGFEMTNREQGARYDSMVGRLDHLKLLSGEIGSIDLNRLEKSSKARAEDADLDDFIVSADIMSATTMSGVRAKIQQYKPDLVCIDGVYLMDAENGEPKGSSAALTDISRSGKRLAQLEDVPVLVTTQALHSKVSRAFGLTANSAGYTSAFGQDADLMIGSEVLEEDPGVQRIKSLANRIGPNVEFEVLWDWSTGTFEEQLDEVDYASVI